MYARQLLTHLGNVLDCGLGGGTGGGAFSALSLGLGGRGGGASVRVEGVGSVCVALGGTVGDWEEGEGWEEGGGWVGG